ncbi:MAG: hypothetical protein RLZZ517_166 [Candidatus Parcubacteria bacterium]|jgi:hypothetical protein
MKKLFLFLSFIIFIFCIKHAGAQVEEIVLYSKDGFSIKTQSFVLDEKGNTSLVKNSDLYVGFKDEGVDFEYDEPKISFEIKDSNNNSIRKINTPTSKRNGESPDLQKYLEDNKEYFDQVRLDKNNIIVKTPVDFAGGEYTLIFKVKYAEKEKTMEHKVIVSKSAYSFSNFKLSLEDDDFLAAIEYKAPIDVEEDVIIDVSLNKEGIEIFKKEFPKKMYEEGTIVIDEKVENIKKDSDKALFTFKIKDKTGEVVYETTQKVNSEHANNMYKYIYIGAILILLTLAFVVIKKVKSKKIKIPTVVFIFMLTSISLTRVYAVEKCGGVNQPEDFCFEDKIVTYVCKNTYTCDVEDARLKKYFSTGNIVNIQTEQEWVGPVSATINICNNIGQTLNTGDAFYVISDSNGSSWQRKRYHVFRFVKGTENTVTFDPGGDKRNVNYATYNGGCSVTVYSRYSGDSSNFKSADTKIIETGKVTPSMCKSKAVNEDTFESNASMLDRDDCTQSELRDTWIAGSVYFNPIYSSNSWAEKTVNVCNYLGYTENTIPEGKAFYALMEQTSSWTMIDYPVFRYFFGTPGTNYYEGNITVEWANKNTYRFDGYKENVPTMKYDGECTITFRLYNRGEDTDSWTHGYKLIELGMVEDATCRDEHIVEHSTATFDGAYRYSGRGLTDGVVEDWTKRAGGKYSVMAPFMRSLSDCVGTSQCDLNGEWIKSYTNTACPPPTCDTSHTVGADAGCSVNNKEQTWQCTNGSWTVSEGSNLCTTLDCTVDNTEVESGDPVTYTATLITNAFYKWWTTPTSQILNENARTYTATYTNGGTYNRIVTATNGTTVQSKSCPSVEVNISCNGTKPNDSACVNGSQTIYNSTCDSDGSWGYQVVACGNATTTDDGTPTLTRFSFSPNMASGTTCPLYVQVDNAQLCKIKNRSIYTQLQDTGTSPTEFSVNGYSYPVGTYTLECAASSTNPSYVSMNAQASCYTNPIIKEN